MTLILIWLANNQIKLKMIRSSTLLSPDCPIEGLFPTVNLDYFIPMGDQVTIWPTNIQKNALFLFNKHK